MRIRLGAIEAAGCADAVQWLVRAQCGVAFVRFLVAPTRLKGAEQKTVALYDIRGGLLTAQGAGEMAATVLPDELAKRSQVFAKRAKALASRHKGSGELPPDKLSSLLKSAKSLDKDVAGILEDVRKECGAVSPSVGCRLGPRRR